MTRHWPFPTIPNDLRRPLRGIDGHVTTVVVAAPVVRALREGLRVGPLGHRQAVSHEARTVLRRSVKGEAKMNMTLSPIYSW